MSRDSGASAKIIHACRACITGYYADARHECTAFCGIDLPYGAHRTMGLFSVDSLKRIAEVTCGGCLVGLDAWVQSTPREQVEWGS